MRITTKDLIQTGIFTAVYAVVYMIFNMTGAIAPVLQFAIGPVAILINGITFMLFLSRVRTPFGPLLMVGLLCVLLVVMGHHFVTLITGLFAGAMASWLAAIWPPEKTAKSVWAYAFFSLWPIGGFLPLLFMRDSVIADITSQMGPEWAGTFNQLMSTPMLILFSVLCFVAGALGGLLGRKVLSGTFKKAGIA